MMEIIELVFYILLLIIYFCMSIGWSNLMVLQDFAQFHYLVAFLAAVIADSGFEV